VALRCFQLYDFGHRMTVKSAKNTPGYPVGSGKQCPIERPNVVPLRYTSP
jgi:hypothetical protein